MSSKYINQNFRHFVSKSWSVWVIKCATILKNNEKKKLLEMQTCRRTLMENSNKVRRFTRSKQRNANNRNRNNSLDKSVLKCSIKKNDCVILCEINIIKFNICICNMKWNIKLLLFFCSRKTFGSHRTSGQHLNTFKHDKQRRSQPMNECFVFGKTNGTFIRQNNSIDRIYIFSVCTHEDVKVW